MKHPRGWDKGVCDTPLHHHEIHGSRTRGCLKQRDLLDLYTETSKEWTSRDSPSPPPGPALSPLSRRRGGRRRRKIRKDGKEMRTLYCIKYGWNERIVEKESFFTHEDTYFPRKSCHSIPPLYAAILRATAWRGGGAKRRGVRSREYNHLPPQNKPISRHPLNPLSGRFANRSRLSIGLFCLELRNF
jgi:hypothetical protein